jgi:hypothetical protein
VVMNRHVMWHHHVFTRLFHNVPRSAGHEPSMFVDDCVSQAHAGLFHCVAPVRSPA